MTVKFHRALALTAALIISCSDSAHDQPARKGDAPTAQTGEPRHAPPQPASSLGIATNKSAPAKVLPPTETEATPPPASEAGIDAKIEAMVAEVEAKMAKDGFSLSEQKKDSMRRQFRRSIKQQAAAEKVGVPLGTELQRRLDKSIGAPPREDDPRLGVQAPASP